VPSIPSVKPARYAVVWSLPDGRRVVGSLELLPDRLRLDGRAADGSRCRRELSYESLAAARIGRVGSERLAGRPALVLERRGSKPLLIGDADRGGALGELAERLCRLLGGRSG
jgi:hypothetical protein